MNNVNNKFIFFNKIINDELEDLTFVIDLSARNDMYTGLSKWNSEKINYNITSFSQKLKAIYKEMFNENLELQKGDISSLTNSLYNVDVIYNNLSRKSGFYKDNGKMVYNHWNASKMMKDIEKVNSKRNKEEYSNCFNFFEYSHINYLIDHLLNSEDNISFNSKKEIVDLKQYFLNWLGHSLQNNQKTGNSVVFISPMHGTGKNVFSNIIKKYYGNEFFADANNDTFTSVHNGILDNKLFVFFNESEININDYEKVSSKLKTLITEEDQIIRKMREEQVIKKSYFNMIINSNSSVPFKIEYNDRRFTVIKNKIKNLKDSVKFDLGLDIEDFVKLVEEETESFLTDLLNLKTDSKTAKHNALMTEAKKLIIKSTNTQVNNVINLINTSDIGQLRDYFFDCENEQLLPEFLEQVSLRFLTNDIVNNFLHINLRENDKNNNNNTKLSKKQFWDKKIGEAKMVSYKKGEIKTTTQVRTLSNFESKNVELFYNKSTNNMIFDFNEENQEYV